jgi:hypothetical protein
MFKYKRKPEYVEAIELQEPVYNKDGEKLADKGDFLVVEGENQRYYKREDFFKEFTLDTEPITIPYPYPVPCPTSPPPCPPVYPDPGYPYPWVDRWRQPYITWTTESTNTQVRLKNKPDQKTN